MQSARKRAGPGLPEFSTGQHASERPPVAEEPHAGWTWESRPQAPGNRPEDMDFRIGILAGSLQGNKQFRVAFLQRGCEAVEC